MLYMECKKVYCIYTNFMYSILWDDSYGGAYQWLCDFFPISLIITLTRVLLSTKQVYVLDNMEVYKVIFFING